MNSRAVLFLCLAATVISAFGMGQTTSPPDSSAPQASTYVEALARDARSKRILGGALLVGGGAVLTGIGVGMESEGGIEGAGTAMLKTPMIVLGAASVLGGAFTLLVPTEAEDAQHSVNLTQDPQQKETLASQRLESLAASGRSRRLINAAFSGGVAVLCFVQASRSESRSSDVLLLLGLASAVSAGWDLLTLSPEEKAYAEYTAASDLWRRLSLGLSSRQGRPRMITFRYEIQ